jgi:sec-independent protein translocase protein TatA
MLSFWHLLVVLLVVLIIFGPGRLSRVMGELGKGVRSLREGLKGDDETPKLPSDKD